jgi:hypothetical protein
MKQSVLPAFQLVIFMSLFAEASSLPNNGWRLPANGSNPMQGGEPNRILYSLFA